MVPYQSYGQNVFQQLKNFGFESFILPALLIFAVVFGIFQKVKIFKTKDNTSDKRMNAIIALIISLIVTLPHSVGIYPADKDPILFIYRFLPNTFIVLIAIFVLLLLVGFVGGSSTSNFTWFAGLIGAAILVLVFSADVLKLTPSLSFLKDSATQAFLIIIGVMALVGYFVINPGKKSTNHHSFLKTWVGEKHPK